MKLHRNVVRLETDGKELLFQPLNSEIALMSADKFNAGFSNLDLIKLHRLGMLSDDIVDGYKVEDFFPTHIAKAYLLLGTDCNICCRYCTVRHNAKGPHRDMIMDQETINNSLAFLFEKNIALDHITLYGGEPLLHKKSIIQIFDYLQNLPHERVPRIDLITNGTIIDSEITHIMKKWDVLVIVSLDGMKLHHDTFRIDALGNGTYDKAVAGILAYQKAGVRVGVSLVLGKHNFADISDICDSIRKAYPISSIGLTLPHMEPDIASDTVFERFLEKHYDKLLEACLKQQIWFEQGMKRLLALAEKRPYIYGCPSTPKGGMIRILPDGSITLCENMGLRGKFVLGNVNDKQFSMAEMLQNEQFKTWYSRCTNRRAECMRCRSYAICGMGCPYDAYLQTGNINSIEKRNCAISRQAVDWYLKRIIQNTTIPVLDQIEVPDVNERKSVLVECPW